MRFLMMMVSALCLSLPALAQSQQNKMKECNTQAAGKKGMERREFMRQCLSNKPAGAPGEKAANPRQRMKECNEQAKGKKGSERKAFMSQCLKNG